MTTLQERLRDGARIASGRGIYLDYVAIAREAADRIDALQELNAQLREQNNSVDSACAYLERQIDALEAEVAEYRKCADDAAMKHKVERDGLMEQVAALTKDAERMRWLDMTTTFFNVDHTEPIRGANIPILSSVSARIWYHATDDTESYPLSAVADAAIKEQV